MPQVWEQVSASADAAPVSSAYILAIAQMKACYVSGLLLDCGKHVQPPADSQHHGLSPAQSSPCRRRCTSAQWAPPPPTAAPPPRCCCGTAAAPSRWSSPTPPSPPAALSAERRPSAISFSAYESRTVHRMHPVGGTRGSGVSMLQQVSMPRRAASLPGHSLQRVHLTLLCQVCSANFSSLPTAAELQAFLQDEPCS